MNKYSFSIGGFWFHLKQISNNSFEDQNGGLWAKKGNMLLSEGGCYNHKIKADDHLDNKDRSMYIRQMQNFSEKERESYHHQRLMFCKGF